METTEIPPGYNFTGMGSANFVSEVFEYDAGGLENIINSSLSALNSIFPSVGDNEAFSLNKDDILNFDDLDIEAVVTDNAGPIGFVVFSGVLGIFMTIVGLFWCACRCCCRNCCVGKKNIGNRQYDPYNQKNSKPKDQHPCVRYICGTLFVLMALVCLALLITSLAVNGQMKRGVNKLPSHVDNALADAQTYLTFTQTQIEDLLKSNYEILSDKLGLIIDGIEIELPGTPFLSSNLYEETSSLEKKISGLENDLKSISRVKTNLNSITSQAGQLESGFQVIKQEYHQLLKECNPEFNQPAGCDSLRKHLTAIETLHVEKGFGDNLSNIPESEWMQELSSVLGDAKQYLEHYQGIHVGLPEEIKDGMRKQVKEIGEYLNDTSFSLTNAIDSVIKKVDDVREDLENAENSVQDFSPYVFTSMILICVALMCIVTVMSVGVVMIMLDNTGDSSSRFYSDKTGSSLINCGIFTVFITYMLFIVVMVAYFIMAGVGGQLLCEAIDALEDKPTSTESPILSYGKLIGHRFGILPRVGNDSDGSFELPSFTYIISELRDNSGAYKTFNLKTAFNTEELEILENQFNISIPATPGRHQMVGRLYELADSRDAKFSTAHFSKQLNTPITSIDLRGLGKNIGKSNLSQNLDQLQVDILEPMKKNVKTTLQGLEPLKFERQTGDLASRMRIIAGALLETRTPPQDAVVEIKEQVSIFGDFAKEKIDNEVGRSGPLYTAYQYAKDGFCVNIVYPVGGFWLGLSVVLALSIPMLILACVMTGIVNRESKIKGYQKLLFCM